METAAALLIAASTLALAGWIAVAIRLPKALASIPQVSGSAPPRQSISVVVPARNEAPRLSLCLSALVNQDIPGLDLVVVDDQSTDETREVAQAYAGVRVIAAGSRPAGWTGKCWAAWRGFLQARGEWILFLDADVVIDPRCIRSAIATADREDIGVLSLLPSTRCVTAAESLVQPVMVMCTLWQLDPRRVNDPQDPAAGASGGFLLFRRAAYERLGGHEAVRGEVVEDLQLALRAKAAGIRFRLAGGFSLASASRPKTLRQLWGDWSRVVFDGLGRRPGAALAAALAVAFVFIFPYFVAPLGGVALALAVGHAVTLRVVCAELARARVIDTGLAWFQPIGALFAVLVLSRAALAPVIGPTRVLWAGREYSS